MKIMLIDDCEIDLFISRRAIEIEGIAEGIIPFRSALTALEYLRAADQESVPDLILLDLKMPCMDGFAFLDKFCHLNSVFKTNIKVIILSSSYSSAEKDMALEYRQCGLVKYLTKPMSKENIAAIKEACLMEKVSMESPLQV